MTRAPGQANRGRRLALTKNNAANTSGADLDQHGFDRPLAAHDQPNPSREAAISAAG